MSTKVNNTNPVLVSIRCLVYNHGPFLKQCLDGFVMQETNFRYEAIVHDDASTDNSADIIREYAEKYPDIIKPILESENQYSKHDGSLAKVTFAACTGKYIATCEGDDFWIDPHKLQKQVDYLESHPECFLSFTNAMIHWDDDSGKPDKVFAPNLEDRDYEGPEMTDDWITPTASFVYRKCVLESDIHHKVASTPELQPFGDIPLVLSCKHLGEVHAFSDITCVYRRHPGSFMVSSDSNRKILVGDYRYCLYKVFGEEYLDSSVISALFHYRRGLYLAKKEKNWSNYRRLLGKYINVCFRHPISAIKRFLKIYREKKALALA